MDFNVSASFRNLFSWHNTISWLEFNWIPSFFRILMFSLTTKIFGKSGWLHYESFNFYCTLNMKSQKSLLCWQKWEAEYDEANILCMWSVYHKGFTFVLPENLSMFLLHHPNTKPYWRQKIFSVRRLFPPKQLVPNLLLELNLWRFSWEISEKMGR